MRLFIGTFLGDGNQAYYRDLAASWSRRFPHVIRAVPSGTVHVTYAFVPHVDEHELAALSAAVADVARSHRPVDIMLDAPGVLWAGRAPRLVEARIASGGTDVMRVAGFIAGSVETSAPNLDLSPAKSAHVTLARFRRATSAAQARRAGVVLGGEARQDNLTAVSIIESRLTPAGPVYHVIADYRLAGQG